MKRILATVLVSLLVLSAGAAARCVITASGPLSFLDSTASATVQDPTPQVPGHSTSRIFPAASVATIASAGVTERISDQVITDDNVAPFCFAAGNTINVTLNGTLTSPTSMASPGNLDIYDSNGISGITLTSAGSITFGFGGGGGPQTVISFQVQQQGTAGNLLSGPAGSALRVKNLRMDATSIVNASVVTATLSWSGASSGSAGPINLANLSPTTTGISLTSGAGFQSSGATLSTQANFKFGESFGNAFRVAAPSCGTSCASRVANDIATGDTSLIFAVGSIPSGVTITFPGTISNSAQGGGGGSVTFLSRTGTTACTVSCTVIYDTVSDNSAGNFSLVLDTAAAADGAPTSGNIKLGVAIAGNSNSGTVSLRVLIGPGAGAALVAGDDANASAIPRYGDTSSTRTILSGSWFTINPANPVPVLTSIAPSGAVAGGASFTLGVTGSNFVPSSVVHWNGASKPTQYVSSTKLTATISPSDYQGPSIVQVTVFNPPPGGGTSAPAAFAISGVSHDDPETTPETSSTGTSTIDTTGATSSPNDPLPGCGNNSTSHSVWFFYSSPGNGTLTIDTTGTSYVPIVGSWKGIPGGVSAGCAVGAIGNSARGGTVILGALLQIVATQGQGYWIMVSAANNDGGKLVMNLGFTANSVLSGLPRNTSLPHVVRGGGYVTKMTVTNMTNATNNVVLNYVAPDGTLVESQTTQLAPAGTARIATPEAQRSQPAAMQWATVGSDAAISANLFFELADANGNVVNTVGFNDAPPVSSFVIPVEFESAVGRTVGLALSNPSGNLASVTLNLVNAQGSTVATSTIPLAAFAKTSFDLASGSSDSVINAALAPITAALAALNGANFIGTLTGASTAPVDVLALGDDQGPFFSTPPLPGGGTRLVVPQIVSGGGYVTKLTLINLTGASNSATVTYYDSAGSQLKQDGPIALAANGAARIATAESDRFLPAKVSWAVVTSTGALGVNLFFEFENNSGTVVNTIGFNHVPELATFTFPVEMEQNNQAFARTMGLALANAGNTTASVTLTLVDGAGNVLATSPLSLPSLNQISVDLSTITAFKTALPAGNFIGSVTVTSNVPIVGLALEDDRGPFSAVPPVAGTPN